MNLRPGQIVILAAGALLVIFSFLTFYDVDFSGAGASSAEVEQVCDNIDQYEGLVSDDELSQIRAGCSISDGTSAWNTDISAPLSLWPALIGLAVAGLVAANAFSNFDPPEVAGFAAPQLMTALAFSGALIMFGYLVMGTSEGQSFGIGFWLMFLGSLALLAGTVMELLQGPAGSVPSPGAQPGYGAPPAPGGFDPQQPPGPPGPPGPSGPPQPPGPDPNAF